MSTKIEWAQETWNPITGCTPISEGCRNCYADRMAQRLAGRYGYQKDEPFKPGTWHLDKIDANLFRPGQRVFVCSMGDLFHEAVNFRGDEMRELFECMALYPETIFMLLTKRPGRMRQCIEYLYGDDFPEIMPHIWLGVTAENQARADERIPVLLQTPAAVRFVSVEPMLGPVYLHRIPAPDDDDAGASTIFPLTGKRTDMGRPCPPTNKLDWVICGGETGPGARPMQSDWARGLRDRCAAAGVPFFFKKHGDWWCKQFSTNPKYRENHELDGQVFEQYPAPQ